MAFASHRTRFKGDLANIEQGKIIELDYNLENIKDRMDYVDNKYNSISKYHEEYTSDFYKVNVNSGDNLSADINIFKALERDANYLLNSLDLPRDKQHKYILLTQEEFDKKINKESKGEITDEAYQSVLAPKDKNVYTNLDLKITNKDLKEESEMGNILRDYQKAKDHLNEENRKIKAKEHSYLNIYKLKLLAGTINCDMLDVKKVYKGITRGGSSCSNSKGFNLNEIDYTNSKHIKGILTSVKFGEIQPDSPLSHIAYDMERAIKELYKSATIDEIDLEIVECINSGMSNVATAKEIRRDEKVVRRRMERISRSVAEFYTYLKIEELK